MPREVDASRGFGSMPDKEAMRDGALQCPRVGRCPLRKRHCIWYYQVSTFRRFDKRNRLYTAIPRPLMAGRGASSLAKRFISRVASYRTAPPAMRRLRALMAATAGRV